MKRFPKIVLATCAAVALTASLAFAADAVAPKNTVATQQVNCPGATAAGYTGQMGPGMMGNSAMGQGRMGQGMMYGNGQGMMYGFGQNHMRGTGSVAMSGRSI